MFCSQLQTNNFQCDEIISNTRVACHTFSFAKFQLTFSCTEEKLLVVFFFMLISQERDGEGLNSTLNAATARRHLNANYKKY